MSHKFEIEFEYDSDVLADLQASVDYVKIQGVLELEADYESSFDTPLGSPPPVWGAVGYRVDMLADDKGNCLKQLMTNKDFSFELGQEIEQAIDKFLEQLETPKQLANVW